MYHFYKGGHVVAQAVGRRSVTPEDRHQTQASPCANYAGQSGTGLVLRRTLLISLFIVSLRVPHTR